MTKKLMVNARNIFLAPGSANHSSYVDDLDRLGIGVQDQLSSNESKTYFHQPDSKGFQEKVSKVLFDNNFEVISSQ